MTLVTPVHLSSPVYPSLLKRHPSRSISPLPRPPAFPNRADKAIHLARNRRSIMSNASSLFSSSTASNKKDKSERTDSTTCSSIDTITSDAIIADLSAVEQSTCLLLKWKSAVFGPSFDDDDASTSTATSSSTLSEDTFASQTSVSGVLQGIDGTENGISRSRVEEYLVAPPSMVPVEKIEAVIIDLTSPVKARQVHFDTEPPQYHYLAESINELSQADKDARWYNRKAIGKQRKDMKEAILVVRRAEQGADSFIDDDHLQPSQCATGCERYLSVDNRYMGQKMMVEAVVENNGLVSDEQLREICRNLSRPNRDLALWHAKLTAIQCWGLAGLKRQSAAVVSNKKRELETGSAVNDLQALKATPLASTLRQLPTPRKSVPAKEVLSLGVETVSSNVPATLIVPNLHDLDERPDTPMEELDIHLAPRIVPYADVRGDHDTAGRLFASEASSTYSSQLPKKPQTNQGIVCADYSKTLEKWQKLSSSSLQLTGFVPASFKPEILKDEIAYLGITSCGAFQ